MAILTSVNVGPAKPADYTKAGSTGIEKRPVTCSVQIREPGPMGTGGSGLVGDTICNLHVHGGSDQAVYAYAREDLDDWERELARPLGAGEFGENFTTVGLDVTGALIGERWRVGQGCVLEVTSPRVPCRTFAEYLSEKGWVRRFTQRGVPGAYLRIIAAGSVRAGDPIELVSRPAHDITVGLTFRAITTEPGELPKLLTAGPALSETIRERALRRDPGT